LLKNVSLLFLASTAALLVYLSVKTTNPYLDVADLSNQQHWYSLQWHGNKVGYVKQRWSQQHDYYQWSQLLQIEGVARGRPFSRVSQEALQFSLDFPYPLISGSWFVDSEQLKQQFTFVVKQQQIEITQNRKTRFISYPRTWNAQKQWSPQRQAVIASQRGGEKNIDLEYWDMQQLEAIPSQFSYGNIDGLGSMRAVSQQPNQLNKKLWNFDASGQVISQSIGAALTLHLSNQSEVLKLTTTDVYKSSLLAVDKPLGKVPGIANLEIEIGEDWQQHVNSTDKVTQASSGEFLQMGLPGVFESQPVENFLEHNTRYPNSQRLNLIAKNLVKKPPTQFLKTKALVDFVSEYIEDKDEINQLTVAQILDNGEGDCSEHALLFVALARSAGLPAREVNGLLYLGDRQQKYSAHVWAEVNIDGNWLSVDPTWRKIGLDAGYIRIYGEQAANTTTLLALSGKTIHVKALSFKI